MSTAKDESYNDELWYQKRITELEHSLQDSEERCKFFEDSGILRYKRITELEQQVEELKGIACGKCRVREACMRLKRPCPEMRKYINI